MSLGSRDDVVFMLHVKRNDRGLTCSSLFTDGLLFSSSVILHSVTLSANSASTLPSLLAACLGGVSRGRLENLDDNLEKKLVLLVEERALVSCVVSGAPTPPYVLLFRRFCPLWNVDRLVWFRGKGLRLVDTGDTGVLFDELAESGTLVIFVFSVDDALLAS